MANGNSDNNRTPVKPVVSYFLKKIWDYSPVLFFIYAIEVVLGFVQPLLATIVPKYIIDELTGRKDVKTIIILILILILGSELCNFLRNILGCIKNKKKDSLERQFNLELSQKAMRIDFENTENPEVLNLISQVKKSIEYAGGPFSLLETFKAGISGILLTIGAGAIFVLGSPWLILIALISTIIHLYYSGLINEIDRKYYQKRSSFDRSFAYVLWQMSDFRFGKDFRLYNAQNLMLGKADYYNGALVKQVHEQNNADAKISVKDSAVATLQSAVIYLYLGIKVIQKEIGIGDFTMYVSATANFFGGIQAAFYSLQMIFNKCFYLGQYVEFMNCEERISEGNQIPEKRKKHSIEFRNVCFSYPGTEKKVLDDVSVTINSSEHISIVGMNGAGKTTFIKLLLGLYRPNQGEILMDGKNINDYSYSEYINLFSAVFQDFKLFSFSTMENVASSSNANVENVVARLKQVGLLEKFLLLEDGLDTCLYKDFDEKGIEPSGGEQQKLAIARALYKDADIVILDEPTAALDPIAEMEVFTQFKDLVNEKTAIFISHRLSTCRFSDRIIVFKDGKVIEQGTHEELLNKENGEYASMFRVQAGYYTQEGCL